MKAIVAILAIMVLEVVALLQGIDGLLLMSSIAIISGLGGYIVTEDIRNGLFDGLLDYFRRPPLK